MFTMKNDCHLAVMMLTVMKSGWLAVFWCVFFVNLGTSCTFQEFTMWKLRKIRVFLMAFYLYLSLLFEQNSIKYIAQIENSVICETF